MRNKFIISVLIPLLILAAMTVKPLMTLFWGQEIKIKTQPVDPVDLFRGDYVILNYEINDLNISQVPELNKVKADLWDYEKSKKYLNKRVYVTLKKADGVYTVESAGFAKPQGKLYLAGKISYFFNKPPVNGPSQPIEEGEKVIPDTARVEYQLDRYFLPENTGGELEDLSRKGQLIATVKTYKGYALLISVSEDKLN